VGEVNFIGWPCCRLTRSYKLDGDGSERYVALFDITVFVRIKLCNIVAVPASFLYPLSVCDFFSEAEDPGSNYPARNSSELGSRTPRALPEPGPA
jgi:hypothetical protein